MAEARLYTRKERASFDLNTVSAALTALQDKDPIDIIVLLTIGGCRHLSQFLTVDHIDASLDLTENELEKHLGSIKRRGWIVRDGNFLSLTEKGKRKEKEIRYTRFETYRRYELKRRKHGRDNQSPNFRAEKAKRLSG